MIHGIFRTPTVKLSDRPKKHVFPSRPRGRIKNGGTGQISSFLCGFELCRIETFRTTGQRPFGYFGLPALFWLTKKRREAQVNSWAWFLGAFSRSSLLARFSLFRFSHFDSFLAVLTLEIAMVSRVTDQTVKTIRRLGLRGSSTREIGELVDLSSASVSYWLRGDRLPSNCVRRPPTQCRAKLILRRKKVQQAATATKVINGKKCSKFASACEIRSHLKATCNIQVSKQTVLTDLRAIGLVSRVRPKVPSTDPANWARRFNWCKKNKGLKADDVVFSDEKFFMATSSGGHRRQWIPKARKDMLHPIEKSGYTDKVMVWGAIGIGFRHLVIVKATGPSHAGVFQFTSSGKKLFVKRSDGGSFNLTSDW